MNRREFVSGLGAAVGAVTVAGANATARKNSGKKPNLVYIFADQLR